MKSIRKNSPVSLGKRKKPNTTLWFLVGVVGGIIFLGWIALLPGQFTKESLNFGFDSFKQVLKAEGENIESAKAAASEALRAIKGENTNTNQNTLNDEEIRRLEQRVFDDPVQ